MIGLPLTLGSFVAIDIPECADAPRKALAGRRLGALIDHDELRFGIGGVTPAAG